MAESIVFSDEQLIGFVSKAQAEESRLDLEAALRLGVSLPSTNDPVPVAVDDLIVRYLQAIEVGKGRGSESYRRHELLRFGACLRKSHLNGGREKAGRPPLPLSAEDAQALERQFGSVSAASAATGISVSTLRRRRAQGEAASHG